MYRPEFTLRYHYCDLTVDTDTQDVFRGDERLDVSGLNFRLLAFFMRRGTQTASFDEIVGSVWAPSQVSNETVTQRIRLLRVALGDHQNKSRYLRSVRGTGYQLCAMPQAVVESTVAIEDPASSRSSYRSIFFSVSLIACLIATAGYLSEWVSNSEPQPISLYEQRLARAQYFLEQREAGDIERALTLLAQIEIDGKHDPRWLLAKSNSLSTKVCRFGAALAVANEAETLAESAISSEDYEAQALAALAYNYDCRGKTKEAISTYRQVVEHPLHSKLDVSSALAYLLGETGHVAESLSIHKGLESEGGNDDFLYLQLARNYELLQYDKLAMRYYRLSFDLYPENIFSNVAYPSFLYSQGFFEQSSQVLAIAETRPHHANLYLLKAEHYLLNKEPALALKALEQATVAKSDFPFFRTLLELNRPDPDIQTLRLRLDEIATESLEQTQAATHLEAALINTRLGETGTAQTELTKAIQAGYLDKGNLQHSRLLASLRELSDYDKALMELDELVATQRALVPTDHVLLTTVE